MPVGDWIAAGKAGAKSVNDLFAVARDNSPDYGMIAKTGMNARSKERQVATKAKTDVINSAIAAEARVRQAEIKADTEGEISELKAGMKRKAGIVGALGAVAGGGLMAFENNRAKKVQAERDAKEETRETERLALMSSMLKPDGPSYYQQWKKDNPEPEPYNPDSSGSDSSSGSSTTSQSLTGVHKELTDAIAGPESGSWGYEAFNQGGAEGGTKVLGKYGSHKETFGRSLTDMTLGEIFKKQNGPKETHYQNGGLHAVGRYQFIGTTLREEVDRMGLSHDTKFTPQIQDDIFFSHIKRIGNISPWIGPSNNYDADKKNYLNSLIPQL